MVLRISSGGRPIPTEDEAIAVLETYQEAANAAGTPQAHEVVRIAGGYGVVVDYVVGLGLGVHVAITTGRGDHVFSLPPVHMFLSTVRSSLP